MEKYLRHEPAEKLGKKARLPSGGRRSQWGELFSPTKCQSVDDILTIKEEVLDIKLEMSDQGMIELATFWGYRGIDKWLYCYLF